MLGVLLRPTACLFSIAVPQFVDVYEDLLITSDVVIESTNLHFTVHEGATLTFQAPAIKIARDQVSRRHDLNN